MGSNGRKLEKLLCKQSRNICIQNGNRVVFYPMFPFEIFISSRLHYAGIKKVLVCCQPTLSKTVGSVGWVSRCPMCFALNVMFYILFKTYLRTRSVIYFVWINKDEQFFQSWVVLKRVGWVTVNQKNLAPASYKISVLDLH